MKTILEDIQDLTMKFFTEKEINDASFGCDDGFSRMSPEFLEMLDALRESCGFPLVCSCYFRTVEWDISEGRSGNSKHTLGIAADIKFRNSWERYVIVQKAMELGFTGIGIHKDFVHVDIREDTPVLWLY